MICDINSLVKKSVKDVFVTSTICFIVFTSFFVSLKISFILGIGNFLLFVIGCATSIVLLKHKDLLGSLFQKFKCILGYKELFDETTSECDVCGVVKCPRHNSKLAKESWKQLKIDSDLDRSIEKFYETILSEFILSWFQDISHDESFIKLVKIGLREATCRLVVKLKSINPANLITNKLLPCIFAHHELVNKMIADGTPMNKLASKFVQSNCAIHPAVLNRKIEVNYLRELTNFLIPELFKPDFIESKIFVSLIRETFAYWALLPLLDVISDPNLINFLIVAATNPSSSSQFGNSNSKHEDVLFLENFVQKRMMAPEEVEDTLAVEDPSPVVIVEPDDGIDFLTDQKILYSFMQFLKKEGAVDVLRFYMDVDTLNIELLDPKVTTDPTKLSSLHQQSEMLFENYQKLMKYENPVEGITTLSEAHEDVKKRLQGKWMRAFYRTTEYFEMLYGKRDADDQNDKSAENNASGPVSRISSKIKGAIRGAVDGAPVEAIEVPTAWEGLNENQMISKVDFGGNTVNNFVSQKLRKERGQHLDPFMQALMQSIEQSADVGEDAIKMRVDRFQGLKKPGENLVFGDLFELKSVNKAQHTTTLLSHTAKGPSQCFIYILVKILRAPLIVIRFALALICVSEKAVDSIIKVLINKLIQIGLYQPRLAKLIDLLHEEIFINKPSVTTPIELLERQKLARERLESLRNGLGPVFDTLQSPPLNKHLIYCLFDIIVADMFPELEQTRTVKDA